MLLIILAVLLVLFIPGDDTTLENDTIKDVKSQAQKVIENIVEKVENLIPPNPEVKQPPSGSHLRIFRDGAVCSDSEICSQIGR